MKDLLITHCDLDGISPIILMNLTGRDFFYKSIEINEVTDTFNELFETDLSEYENIYVTDLTLPMEVYDKLKEKNLIPIVFDHHETHLYAKDFENVTVKTHLYDRQTCGTELFYEYLKSIYNELDKPIIKEYVDLVRELDTYNFTSNKPKELELLMESFGKTDFIKSITKRLKKDKEIFEFTSFEKRFVRLKTEEMQRYMQKMEKKMIRYEIDGKLCGVVFAEIHKSELGNYLSSTYPELDLIILLDTSSRISYRTCRDDIKVNDFAANYNGGGHPKASGSSFTDDNRFDILKSYFKDVKRLEDEKN